MIQNTALQQQNFDRIASRQATITRARNVIAPITAANMAALAWRAPNLNAGQVAGLGLAGIGPDDPVVDVAIEEQMKQQAVDLNQSESWLDNYLYDPLKGIIRTGMTLLGGLMEETESINVRSTMATYQELAGTADYGMHPLAAGGRSDAFHMLRELFSGNRVNLGEGFFPNSTIAADVQHSLSQGATLADAMAQSETQRRMGTPVTLQGQLDRERVKMTSPGGKEVPVSLGRALAINVAEPGTQAFHYMSGMMDFAKQVVFDPADYLLAGAGKVRLLSKVPVNNLDDLDFMARSLAKIPLPGSARKTIHPGSWDTYLKSSQGEQWVDWFTQQQGAAGARNIRDLLISSRRGGSVDPEDIRKLTNSTDRHLTQNLLADWGQKHQGRLRDMPQVFGATAGSKFAAPFNAGIISAANQLSTFGSDIPMYRLFSEAFRDTTKYGARFTARQKLTGTYLGRMTASVGSKAVNVADERDAVDSLDEYMRALQTPDDVYEEALWKAINPFDTYEQMKAAGNADEYTMYNHYFGVVKDITNDFTSRMGADIEPEYLKGIEKIFRDTTEFRSYWKNNMDEDMVFGGANVTYVEDGVAKAMPSAVLFSQFLDQAIPLLDLRKVRGIQRRSWIDRLGKGQLKKYGAKVDEAEGLKGKAQKPMGAGARFIGNRYGMKDYDDIGEDVLTNIADFGISKLWKPAVLLRVAWPVRVIGEEQLRLGAAELAGVFNHPMQFYSLVMARKTPFLRKMARASTDVFEQDFMSQRGIDKALATQQMTYAEALHAGKPIRGYESVNKADLTPLEVAEARVFALNQGATDPVGAAILDEIVNALDEHGELPTGFNALDNVKKRFYEGDLRYVREAMLNDASRFQHLGSQTWSDEYVDNVFAYLIHQTGGQAKMTNTRDGLWRGFDGRPTDPPAGGLSANQPGDPRLDVLERQRQRIVDRSNPYNDNPLDMDEVVPEMDNMLQNIATINGVDPNLMNRSQNIINQIEFELEDWYAGNSPHGQMDDLVESAMDDLWAAAKADLDELGISNPGTGLPAREMFPAQEAQALGELGRNRFVEAYQTLPQSRLGADDVLGTDAKAAARTTVESNVQSRFARGNRAIGPDGDTYMSYDELKNVERGTVLDLGATPEWSYGGDSHMWAIMGDDGRPAVMLEYIRGPEGELLGVPLFVGYDARMYKRLIDDLVQREIFTYQDVLTMHTSNKRLLDEIQKHPDMPDVVSYDDFARWLDEDPAAADILKDTLPNLRMGTDTTEAGSVLSYRFGMKPAIDDSKNWPQARPTVYVDDYGDPNVWRALRGDDVTLEDGTVFNWGDSHGLKGKQAQEMHARRAAFLDTDEQYAKAPQFVNRPVRSADANQRGIWDRAVDNLYEFLMSKPTDFLSRSPAYRQFYWRRIAALMDETDEAAYQQLMEAARKANVVDDDTFWMKYSARPMRLFRSVRGNETAMDQVLRRLGKERTEFADDALFAGETGLREIDEIAKAYALEETKRLLYDMSENHMWADQLRHIMPFAEAWFEVMSTWARLVKENPRVLNRMRQGIEGARESNPFAGVNADGEQDHGLFYRNPETGEEMFAYPGSGLISSMMLGDAAGNVQLEGRANALNIAAGVLPGLGPLVQIPISHMGWANDPNNREIRDLLLPFGKSTVDIKNPASWVSPIMPGWFQKGLAGFFGDEANTADQQRVYHNTVIDVYKTLTMQGWDVSTEEGIQATLAEAGRIAQNLYKIRSLAQFAGPAGASARWQVAYDINDETGTLWSYQALATEYRRLLDENQGDQVQAYQQFTNMFGVDPMLFSTSKTQKVLPRAVTIEARKFEYDNPDLFEDFPRTAYYANPDPIDGDFDYESYLYTLREDARQPLTPDQWAHKRNQFLGRIAYDNFQREADKRFRGNPQIHAEWLRRQYQALVARYPGYGTNIPGLPETPSLDDQIAELYNWYNDDRLIGSDVGRSLDQYLQFRDQMVRLTQSTLGYQTDTGFRTGKRAVLYRQRLKQKGEQLVALNPDFLPLWEQILSREIQEPDWTQQPLELAGVSF